MRYRPGRPRRNSSQKDPPPASAPRGAVGELPSRSDLGEGHVGIEELDHKRLTYVHITLASFTLVCVTMQKYRLHIRAFIIGSGSRRPTKKAEQHPQVRSQNQVTESVDIRELLATWAGFLVANAHESAAKAQGSRNAGSLEVKALWGRETGSENWAGERQSGKDNTMVSIL